MKSKLIFIISILLFLQSCNFHKPEDYFGRTTLNVNNLRLVGRTHFEQMILGKENSSLYASIDGKLQKTDNCELYVKTAMTPSYEHYITQIEELKPTADTKEMIDASLDLFNFILEKHNIDYIKIAKLIDANADKKIIEAAITKFEEDNFPIIGIKVNHLFKIAKPYAQKHHLNVTWED